MPSYQSPGVYIEEISAGQRPVQPSSTHSTGFVGVLELPEQFRHGHAAATKAFLPVVDQSGKEGTELSSWDYARAYFDLGWDAEKSAWTDAEAADHVRLDSFIGRILSKYGVSADDTTAEHVVFAQHDKTTGDDAKTALETKAAACGTAAAAITHATPPVSREDKKKAAAKADLLAAQARYTAMADRAAANGIDTGAGASLGPKVRVPLDKRLFNEAAVDVPVFKADGSIVTNAKTGLPEFTVEKEFQVSLSVLDSPSSLIDALTAAALRSEVALTASLPGTKKADGSDLDSIDIDIEALQTGMAEPGFMCTGMDNFHSWRSQFGRKLFIQLQLQVKDDTKFVRNAEEASALWDQLSPSVRKAWNDWLRSTRGMRLLELSLNGFFANGGAISYLAMAIYPKGTQAGVQPGSYLEKWFNTVGDCAMLVAPGLNKTWQSAILNYAGPNGRVDLFAIMDTPRYLLTQPTDAGIELGKDRWVMPEAGVNPYEGGQMDFLAKPEVPELRHNPDDIQMDSCVPRDNTGHGAAYAPWFIVANPLASGADDAFVVAPPSGFMAGAYAANDNRIGVHKVPANQVVQGINDLLCTVTSVEQGPLNGKSINLIRHRPSGLTIWGGRTTSNDPLWRYINKRRVFLFCERSIRDAVQWAVFLPNNDTTRSDLRSTIDGFLYAQWQNSVLDGASQDEAYSVQCDEGNNPLVLRKQGLLHVDVGIQPPYPAEFVIIRFREQS